MSQKLAYLNLAKKNPTYQNLATAITTPGLLNTDGTPATGGAPRVISASTQEPSAFEKDLASIRGASDISAETKQELLDARLEKEVGGGMSAAELQDFESLIGRLESSKMRQAGQGNQARQRETYAGGLASMMRNF
jgi:hypothetical protein